MKNILITTAYEADTLHALKIAADLKRNNAGNIVLLSTSELSDSITELLFLSVRDRIDQEKRKALLEEWRALKEERGASALTLEEHHQFGMSRPILEQLLERFAIDMIVVPQSFQHSKQYIHRMLLRLLHKSKLPLLLLPVVRAIPQDIQRALYLDEKESTLSPSLQNLPFHIIHQSMIKHEEESLELLVDKLKINLIVQPKQTGDQHAAQSGIDNLGLPVLTI